MAGAHGQIWKKRILVPLWVIQLIACIVFLGLSALGLWAWNNIQDEVEESNPELADYADSQFDTSAAVNFAFSIFTILMVFVEMVLFCTHRLSPVLNIVIQSIKSAIWTFYFVITIISVARGLSSGFAIFLVLVIFLTSIGLLAYGATMVHRKRKGTLYRGNYAAANADTTRYEPSRFDQTTGYTASSNPNPFRDPSPAPPYNPHATCPASRPVGEAGEYYGGGGSYEMQHGAGR